jgi:hypothetical protein
MLRNYYLNKQWMVSRTARRVYRISAGLSLALLLMFIAIPRAGEIPEYVRPTLRLLVLLGVCGAAITMVAMEYFLFGFDNSSTYKKVFWFCVMLLPPLGPPLYCFLVYSRSDLFKGTVAERGEGASASG